MKLLNVETVQIAYYLTNVSGMPQMLVVTPFGVFDAAAGHLFLKTDDNHWKTAALYGSTLESKQQDRLAEIFSKYLSDIVVSEDSSES